MAAENTEIAEHELTSPWQGFLAGPTERALERGESVTGSAAGRPAAGVVVLSGSSGRIERDRCRLLARAGVTALSIRWFGGPEQPAGVCEIPLETFAAATELLRDRGAARVSLLGVSKGAEAALSLSTVSGCADAVIALAPTSVVWANVGPGRDGHDRPYRSCWTWQGRPLPFVPYDETWTRREPEGAPVSVLGWYERSLATHADRLAAAAIPVEATAADLVLVAGGADRMWPSLRFARELAGRRAAHGIGTTLVSHPDAGHRVLFPDEVPPAPSTTFDHGGSPEADAALGTTAWPTVLAALRGA
ncbi:hypothetical protein SAMN05216267_102049 [Actinacidiphila rubida]|uniref:BAAT/Acyl-CoA thioester hydrolase C-terminal domain-containing protein n=1 Tax=Actinacidiphila rubida TaxID=310780 RepID=A0A1H8MX27_9ACTN|nr:acyl-CoA thioester hydrolase/BAAT C-terminal domain-containing protein [Actinacidiphila rubida]SEO21786.1 hypothetical protein SAMN05216267_102049 [Actinacidiphila rubida]